MLVKQLYLGKHFIDVLRESTVRTVEGHLSLVRQLCAVNQRAHTCTEQKEAAARSVSVLYSAKVNS